MRSSRILPPATVVDGVGDVGGLHQAPPQEQTPWEQIPAEAPPPRAGTPLEQAPPTP